MGRPKKDYITLNVKVEAGIMEDFIQYCQDKGQTKTTAIERILRKYLDEYREEENSNGRRI